MVINHKFMKNNLTLIAEIANAHQGNPEIAVKIAEEAFRSGANAIKFQMYTADDLLVKKHKRYKHFKNQSFSIKDWDYIFKKISQLKIKVYLDIFGLESLKIAIRYKVDGFKIHFSDLKNTPLLKKIASLNKKIFIGTGGANIFEIKDSIEIINSSKDFSSRIILLHGYQAYPTFISDTNINRIKFFKKCFGKNIDYGLSDHISGDLEFAKVAPLLAIQCGAKYIEKHITNNRSEMGTDYYSSLESEDFKILSENLKNAVSSLGLQNMEFSEAELNYRNSVKKKWISNQHIKEGEIITIDKISLKREDSNLKTLNLEEIINKKVISEIKPEEVIKKSNLEYKVLAIVVARSKSSRLKNKATMKINGDTSLEHLFKRLKISLDRGFIDKISFCTTTFKEDDQLENLALLNDIEVFRGANNNVLKRMMLAIEKNYDHDVILRITGDDIFIDPDYLQKTVIYHLENNLDYTNAKDLPTGTDLEVINSSALKKIYNHALDLEGTEYLTNYIVDNKNIFKTGSLNVPKKHISNIRLTLDTKEDFELIDKLCTYLCKINRKYDYNLDDILNYFSKHPSDININSKTIQRKIPIKFKTELSLKNNFKK
jgi:N,N'-diacetyllegionaminate synthase